MQICEHRKEGTTQIQRQAFDAREKVQNQQEKGEQHH